MRFIFAIIGYLCVATVLSLALGITFLWQSQRLTDEKVFRMVALVHGVDVDGAAEDATIEEAEVETPGEEPSLAQEEKMRQIALRNFEVKQNALERGRKEFDHIFRQMTNARDQIDSIASELEQRIEEEVNLAQRESINDVVNNLKSLKADKAKNQLLKILNSGGADPEAKQAAMDDVIRLLKALPANTRTGILKKFTTELEQQQLNDILQQMLEGGPQTRNLKGVMKQLKDRDFSA